MSKKLLFFIVPVLIVVAVIVFIGLSSKTSASSKGDNANQSYTMQQVSEHKDASSCWSAVNGKVYDLTSFINRHPGGANRILSICGRDGSQAFNSQHASQRRPEQELKQLLIGNLAAN